MELKILYQDKYLAVVIKPAGVSSQESHDFKDDMVSLLQKQLDRDDIYVVHRLDQMVSGVMVYALDKDTAGKLQIISKHYQAILDGIPKEKKGTLTDWLVKGEDNKSKVCDPKTKGAKDAKLNYKVIENKFVNGHQRSRVDIELITGRHHQIRAQLSSRGWPIVGDVKYGYKSQDDKAELIALAAVELELSHPKTKKVMRFKYDWNRDIS